MIIQMMKVKALLLILVCYTNLIAGTPLEDIADDLEHIQAIDSIRDRTVVTVPITVCLMMKSQFILLKCLP